jgi:pimeloyl-ACP methyl ester carboxylesterase
MIHRRGRGGRVVHPRRMLPAPALPAWLDALLPFRRGSLEVRGYRMHVMEQGPREGLPVLLLHGNPTWGFLWRKVARALADAPLRLVMPDLVGLGLSEHPRDPEVHTLDFHARQVGALVDALQLERFVIVGQDWGGPIGGCVCADRPERVAGAVVLNTVLGPPKPGFRPAAFHRFARWPVASDLAFRLLNVPARGMSLAQGDRASVAGDVGHAYRWVLRDRRTNGAPLALARMVPDTLSHPSVPRLEQCEAWARSCTGPAAIVWGQRDPLLGRLLGRTRRTLPHARVWETQAGHFLQEEVPEDIAAAIRFVALGQV